MIRSTLLKQILRSCAAIGIFVFGIGFNNAALAVPVEFDFDFFNADGSIIGDGFYRFDDINPSNKASFASLVNFSWSFNIPTLGISLASSVGDIPSSDSLVNEGIILTGLSGQRTLTFFDDVAERILHRDMSQAFPIGVEFRNTDTTRVSYIPTTNVSDDSRRGTFIAREVASIPEPTTITLILAGLVGFGYRRRYPSNN